MKPAAQLLLGAVFSLLAIAPVPFQKWALPRIASGGFALVCFSQAKKKLDNDLSLQRQVDVHEFDELAQQKQIVQSLQAIEIQATQERELIRTQFQNELEKARMQEHFVVAMEHERPGYLEYQEAQRIANLQAQGYSAGVQDGGRAIVSADGSEVITGAVEATDRGQRLLQRLRKSDMSILIVGSTGAGKSHTLSAYLEFLYQDSPDADVWVISRKNDSFCGLREAGRVVRFNSLDPVDALEKLREFHAIFQERTEVLEEDRCKLSTVRLILEDWSSICLILKTNKTIWNEVKIILSDIVTVGRDLNICLVILAQSAILESLGLVGDANLRTCLAIVAQGLESINNKGEEQGDYNLIQLILQNSYIIPSSEDRESLSSELVKLIPESRQIRQPVFLCTSGKPFVGFLPKITKITVPIAQPKQGVGNNSNTSSTSKKQEVNSAPIASIETQKAQLDATFKKAYNPLDHLFQEASQEELDELIRGWRELADTSASRVSDTLIPKEVSDTENQGYQTPKPLLGKESQSIWTEEDFAKHLPKKDEGLLFEELVKYQDESQDVSKIIKIGWGFTGKYQTGRACFVYLITKYGGEAQKKLYADYINQYLGVDSQDGGVER